MSMSNTKIVYRGARTVVRHGGMWGHMPSNSPTTTEERARMQALLSRIDGTAIPVPAAPVPPIYDSGVQVQGYGWHAASVVMMALIVLCGFYATAH